MRIIGATENTTLFPSPFRVRHVPCFARGRQDEFWILDSTPYYMKEAERLTRDELNLTEARKIDWHRTSQTLASPRRGVSPAGSARADF